MKRIKYDAYYEGFSAMTFHYLDTELKTHVWKRINLIENKNKEETYLIL